MAMVGVSVFGQGSREYLYVNTNRILFSSGASSQMFNIESNVEWSISVEDGSDWLTVTPFSGQGSKTITVSARENTSTTRNAAITVNSEGLSRTIYVSQYGIVPTPGLPSSMSFSALGGTQTFSFTSNEAWTITSSSADWLSVSPDSGSGDAEITVTVTENTSFSDRTTTLTIRTESGQTHTIQIVQYGQTSNTYLTVSTSNLAFTSAGGTLSFLIASNINWYISIVGGSDWLTVTPDHGSGDGTVAVTAAPNATAQSRTAQIVISGNGITQTITVFSHDGDGIIATNADTPQKQQHIFNLQGQKMNRVMPHGIYIINGKKVLK